MSALPTQHVIDVTQKPIGFWIGRDPRTRRAQTVGACPACLKHGVPIRVVRRVGCRSEAAYAHRVLPHGYELVCVLRPKSGWVAPPELRKRLAAWLDWALRPSVLEPDGKPTLRRLAALLGLSWQAVNALPRCARRPSVAVMTALELHSQGMRGGPITAAEWGAGLEELPRYPI